MSLTIAQRISPKTMPSHYVSAFVAAVVTAFLVYVLDGNPVLALVLPLGVLFVWGLCCAPIRLTAHGLLFLGLLIDNPTERPGRNLYRSPLYIPGTFLYETLEKSAHVPGAKISGLQLLVLFLFALMGVRALGGDRIDGTRKTVASRPLVQACLVAIVDLLLLWVWGMSRGGVTNYALLQMQTMIFLPLMTLLFYFSFHNARDARAVIRTLLVVGTIRALMCIYYWITVIRKAGEEAGGQEGDGSYVTTHSDSILATVCVIICIVAIYQRPRVRAFMVAGVLLPIIGLGIVANNRRIAFVGIGFGLLFSYLAGTYSFRRRVHQTVLTCLPIAILYVGAGWSSHGSWAKPVQSLRSVIEQKDSSSATRDVENFNLLQTLKQNPIIGSGYGHKYIELVHAFDISTIFEAYRYVPHNSVLWFWGVGGIFGFTFFWLCLSAGVYYAARLLRMPVDSEQKIAAMAAIGAVCSYSMQSFGDMGLMSWMGLLTVSSLLGLCGALVERAACMVSPQQMSAPLPEHGVQAP